MHNRQEIQFSPFESIIAENQTDKNDCLICLRSLAQTQMYQFGACGHQFCQTCLTQSISFAIKKYSIPKCPQQGCNHKMTIKSASYRFLSKQERQRLAKIGNYYQIINNPNLFPCQADNCNGFVNKLQQQGCCLECGRMHCLNCLQIAHKGQCQIKVAIDLQTMEKFRQCQQCGQIIQKTEGCTHMQCTCGHYFCYSCGETLTGANHECTAPSQLNCMQTVRWQIEHQELWYQSSFLNFLKYLLMVSPPQQADTIIKIIWCILFLIVFYPLSIALAISLAILAVIVLFIITLIMSLMVPFLSICPGNMQLWPTADISEQFGPLPALLFVIIFYPILYICNLVALFYQLVDTQDLTVFFEVLTQLIKGIRNILLVPCLMFVNNRDYYLGLGRKRQMPQVHELQDELEVQY